MFVLSKIQVQRSSVNNNVNSTYTRSIFHYTSTDLVCHRPVYEVHVKVFQAKVIQGFLQAHSHQIWPVTRVP